MEKDNTKEQELAEASYVAEYCSEYLTKEERLARMISLVELKTPVKKDVPESQRVRDMRMADIVANYSKEEITKAREIIEVGMTELALNLRERVLRENPKLIARCRKCNGVLRTPKARQCRWCGFDWHLTVV